METDPWGLPYKVATKKLTGRQSIEGLTTPGRMDHIVDTLFPAHQTTVWADLEVSRGISPITETKMAQLGANLPTNKVPGPDGIPDVVFKTILGENPGLLLGTLNKCLEEGRFPRVWKEARLVLLRKGTKLLEQPTLYRPICLLSTVGKLYERVLKTRVEAHLEAKGGLSDRHYGFRRGRSTVDAFSADMKLVNGAGMGPLHRRELCALVSLDVANAFNSASWRRIEESLVAKGVPAYLVRVLTNYLSERSLLYGDSGRREISSGVLQGCPQVLDVERYERRLVKNQPPGQRPWVVERLAYRLRR